MQIEVSEDLKLLLPLITLFIGAFLGFISSVITIKMNQKNQISNEIIKRFFLTREDICDKVCALTNLNLNNSAELNNLNTHIDEVSKLYYKNYHFLPKEVLYELNCLYACLMDQDNSLYKSKNGNLKKLTVEEYEKYFEDISIINNFKYVAYYNMFHPDIDIKRISSINYQARNVLRVLNKYFNTQRLAQIVQELKK